MYANPRLKPAGLALAILALLVGPALLPLSAPVAAEDGPYLLTAEGIDDLRRLWGMRDDGREYNVVIDGHGTGLAPPSEEDYEALVGRLTIGAPEPLPMAPSSVDLSDDPWFPPVGNQGSQGSCAAWATAYYCYGYQEARDQGWTDVKTNPAHRISPAWAYNMVCGGVDRGSWMTEIGEVMRDWGVATMATMPYNAADFTTWGGEAAFREAPLHRVDEVVALTYQGDATIEQLKNLLASGIPVTFTITASNIRSFSGNYILSSAEYQTSTPDHAQTLVGYDDSMSEGGEMGAFKVVNSWGTSSGDKGFYWLTYDAIKEMGAAGRLNAVYVTDRPSYEPSTVAVWHFDSAPRQSARITMGAGDPSSPQATKRPAYETGSSASSVSMPNFMLLDITELASSGPSSRPFYLNINGAGTLSALRLEHYSSGYEPGRPTQVSDVTPSTSLPGTASCSLAWYEASTLDAAVDALGLGLTTGGTAGWTAVGFERSFGSTSAQSGDIASGTSWMRASLVGPTTLSFNWKIEAMGYGDYLTMSIDGTEVLRISGTTGWRTESVEVPGGVHEVTWTYHRSGHGGGSGFVDRVQSGDRSLRADNNDELTALAQMMGWTGSGLSAGDPIVAAGLPLSLSEEGDGLYLGNTTLHFTLRDSSVDGAKGGAGIHLYKAANVRIEGNDLSGNELALLIEECFDITVAGNVFSDNGAAVVASASWVDLTSNELRANGLGLDLAGVDGIVAGNLFEDNIGLAIRADSTALTVTGNAFLRNNGIAGANDGRAQAADLAGAAWHRDGQGNHWSDWTVDADGDGLADSPYSLGGAADAFPFAAVASPPATSLEADADAIVLTWSEPAFLSGRTVVRYEVELTTASGTTVQQVGAGVRSLTDEDPVGGRSYTYRVRAVVDLGAGAWSAPRTVVLDDLVAPSLTILSPGQGGWVGTSTVRVAWSGSDEGSGLDHYEVRMDGGPWQAVGVSSQHSFSGVVSGSHTVQVRAYDRQGNMAEASVAFSVDITAPTVEILSPSAGVVGSSTVTITASVWDQGSGPQSSIVRVDGNLLGTFDGTTISTQVELADGPHTVTVTSRDAAGNAAVQSVSFVVDTAAPSLTILAPVEGTTASNDLNVTCSFSDLAGPAWAEVRLDGGEWFNISATGSHRFTGLADGTHVVEARAWDQSGKVVERSVTFTIDTSLPTVSLEQEDGMLRLRFSEEVDRQRTECNASFPFTARWEGGVLVILPDQPLERGTQYQLVVRSADLEGRPFSQALTFVVGNAGWVTGTVVGPDGAPLVGAFVVFDDGTAVATAADGSFTALVEGGPRTFTVERDGTSYGPYDIVVVPGMTVEWGLQRLGAPAPGADLALLAVLAVGTAAVLVALLVVLRRRA